MKRQLFTDSDIQFSNIVTTATSTPTDVRRARLYGIQAVVTVNTPAAVLFAAAAVSIAANTATATAHGFTTGLKGQLTTSVGLPAGLSGGTDYFIVVIDANTIQFATSLANATASTPVAVDITSQGTGNHTFTPTPLAGGAVKLQKSNVPAVLDIGYSYSSGDWTDVAAAVSLTASGTTWFEVGDPAYRALLIHYTLTAGRMSSDNYIIVKG